MSRSSQHVAIVLSLILLVSLPAAAAPTLHAYRADLAGANEVPPNASPGVGTAHIVIDTSAKTLSYYISYSGLTAAETAAHIHGFAPPGANGGVVHALPAGNPKVGTWTYAAVDEPNILAGFTYVNIHTGNFPGGEIRGQIVPDASIHLVARLEGAQEVPATPSAGLGIAFFTVDPVADMLSYDVRFAGLIGAETAAHIHGFAPAGVNAGVLVGLPLGSPKIGVWNYGAAQEADLLSDLAYVNIHTTMFPGGEIRGQIINLAGPTGVTSPLESADAGLELRAFPNPVRGESMALYYRSQTGAPVRIQVVDVQGRVVRELETSVAGANGIVAWDTRDDAGRPVATGVYFARVISGAATTTGRVVVLR